MHIPHFYVPPCMVVNMLYITITRIRTSIGNSRSVNTVGDETKHETTRRIDEALEWWFCGTFH